MPLNKNSTESIEKWFDNRNLAMGSGFIDKAGQFLDLVREWSERMNLVSKNDIGNIVERHFLDSLIPITEIPRTGKVVDIGSGAGFPAIPIALARPELHTVMIESIRKKVIFLNEAISRLSLERVSIWHGRLEDFRPVTEFDIATIRAVAVTERIRKHLGRIMGDSGKIIYYNKFNNYILL